MDSGKLRAHWKRKYVEVGVSIFLNMQMKNIKSWLSWMPEIYVMISVIFYWIDINVLLNPIAIILFIALLFQLLIKHKATGIIISILFVMINLYLVFALLSEYHEFKTFDNAANNLLFFGTLYIGLNILMGIMMLIKYIKIEKIPIQLSV